MSATEKKIGATERKIVLGILALFTVFVVACGGFYLYQNRFSDTGRLELCADYNYKKIYTDRLESEYEEEGKKRATAKLKLAKEVIEYLRLDDKLKITPEGNYEKSWKQCEKELKDYPKLFVSKKY